MYTNSNNHTPIASMIEARTFLTRKKHDPAPVSGAIIMIRGAMKAHPREKKERHANRRRGEPTYKAGAMKKQEKGLIGAAGVPNPGNTPSATAVGMAMLPARSGTFQRRLGTTRRNVCLAQCILSRRPAERGVKGGGIGERSEVERG
jgi:hypothetical protein